MGYRRYNIRENNMKTRSQTKPPKTLEFHCDDQLEAGLINAETGADIVGDEFIDWESWRTRTGPLFVEAFTSLRDKNLFQIVKVHSVIQEQRPEILRLIVDLGYAVQFVY